MRTQSYDETDEKMGKYFDYLWLRFPFLMVPPAAGTLQGTIETALSMTTKGKRYGSQYDREYFYGSISHNIEGALKPPDDDKGDDDDDEGINGYLNKFQQTNQETTEELLPWDW